MANACARGRPIAPLVLSAQERTYLERQVRRHRVARLAVFSPKYDPFLRVIDEYGLQSHRTQLVRARTIQTAPCIRTPFEVR